MTIVMVARNTANETAASAAPDLDRYLARSRSASRVASGARQASLGEPVHEERGEQGARDHAGDQGGDDQVAVAAAAVPAAGEEQHEQAGGQEDEAGAQRPSDHVRRGDPAGDRGDHRDLADRASRPGGGDDGGGHGEQQADDHGRPGQVQRVGAVRGGGLQVRVVPEPEAQPERRADDRAEHAGDQAVDDQHEPDVALGRAERGEHAEGALPALGHHGERGGRDQADEGQAEHRDDQHDRRRGDDGVRRLRRGDGRVAGDDVAGRRRGGRVQRYPEEDPHVLRRGEPGARPGGTRANSSSRFDGFSTMPVTVKARPALAPAEAGTCQTEPIRSR